MTKSEFTRLENLLRKQDKEFTLSSVESKHLIRLAAKRAAEMSKSQRPRRALQCS
jgi:hypothetical protein